MVQLDVQTAKPARRAAFQPRQQVLRGKPATWGVLGNPRRAAEISKVNFGNKKRFKSKFLATDAFLLVFYKSGFNFIRRNQRARWLGWARWAAFGDNKGVDVPAKAIHSG